LRAGDGDHRMRRTLVTLALALVTVVSTYAQSNFPPSGSGSSASQTVEPNSNSWFANPNCGTQTNCTTIKDDAHWVNDATFTNTSGVVTAPDGNFTGSDIYGRVRMKTGQKCFGTSNFINGTLYIAEGTISSINSATSATCSATSSSNATANAIFVWGDLDTSAAGSCATPALLVTAWQSALANNAALRLPGGAMLVECGPFQDAGSNTRVTGDTIFGENQTYIIPTPNYDLTATNNLGGNTGLFFYHTNLNQLYLPNEDVLQDFTIWCGGNSSFASAQSSVNFMYLQRAFLKNITAWGCGSGDISGIIGLNFVGPDTIIAGLFYNFGGTTCQTSNSGENQTVTFTGQGYCAGGQHSLTIGPGSIVNSTMTFYGPGASSSATILVSAGGIFNSFGDIIDGESTVVIDNSGTVNLYGSQMYESSVAPTFGLVYARAGSSHFFQGSIFNLTATGGVILGGAGLTGFHTDGGANKLLGATGAPCLSSSCTLTGSASITGTTVTAAKLVLSANYGTSAAVSVPVGQTQAIAFTITNGTAATGANPTITYTFPPPYFVAPFWCTATQVGGTNPVLPLTSGTPSTTSVVFTVTGTPTANDTELMQVQCVGP